jgi:hypothetical protein
MPQQDGAGHIRVMPGHPEGMFELFDAPGVV